MKRESGEIGNGEDSGSEEDSADSDSDAGEKGKDDIPKSELIIVQKLPDPL